MQIIIEGADTLPDGFYGSVATMDGDTLRLVVDPTLDPTECPYPVTKGKIS